MQLMYCSTGQVHWSGPLVRSTGQVHWSGPLVRSTGQVHWSGPLVRSSKCIKIPLGISIYKTLEQFYYTPAHFTHFILVKFLKKISGKVDIFTHAKVSRYVSRATTCSPAGHLRDFHCGNEKKPEVFVISKSRLLMFRHMDSRLKLFNVA
jgi:hypothetical protein